MKKKSKEILEELIRNDFDRNHQIWSNRPNDLIELARKLNLNKLANEMQKDL